MGDGVMLLETRYFGELEIDESKIISFDEGLPGFEEVRRFVMIDNEDKGSPFKWLQGVDEPKPAFVIVDPFAVKRDYEINIDDETLDKLGIGSPDTVAVYSIVVVPEDISKMTMNLQAPLIINTENRRGKQLILDTERYGVRHYIIDELQGREDAENARADAKKGSVRCYK
jgi:flagellar assembly factor FliW